MNNSKTYNKILLKIIVIVCIIAIPELLFSQDTTNILNKKVSLNIKNKNIYEALKQISLQSGYNFSYNSKIISENKEIKIKTKDTPIINVLNTLLQDSTLLYKTISNQIVIYKQLNKNLNINTKKTAKLPYRQIKGKIIDSKTYQTLAYANISIEGTTIGSISNSDGEFIFNIPNNSRDKNIVVSFIGYKNLFIPLSKLTNFENLLMLEPNIVPIQEVIIRNSSPLSILQLAINEIPNNYTTKPIYLRTFYRETIKQDKEIAAVLEAVVDIYKTGYNSSLNDRIKLKKTRKNIDYNIVDTIMFKIKGGLQTSMILDIIKSKANFIDSDLLYLYTYNISDIINFNGNDTYVISFEPKIYNSEEILYTGDIYIDIKTLAIKKAEFWLSNEAIRKSGHLLVIKRAKKTIVKPTKAHYTVTYKEFNGLNYLNYINGYLVFKVRKKGKLFSNQFDTSIELAINKIDTTNIEKIRYRDISNTRTILFDKTQEYKNSFWDEYNFIKPNESLQKAIQKINN